MKIMSGDKGKSKYSEKLKNPKWQKIRLKILERDEWVCQRCFDDESTLAVHHRYYIKGKEPWDYPIDAFVTLCENCHQLENEGRTEAEQNLLFALRKKEFLFDNLQEIADGFNNMKLVHNPDVVASILNWTLSNNEIQGELKKRFFEAIKPKREKSQT